MMAREVTLLLQGRWFGCYGTAACPCCQTEKRIDQNALTLADGEKGRLLAHCKKSACAFADILSAAGIAMCGNRSPDPAYRVRYEAGKRAEAAKRAKQAESCWKEANPITGSVAEVYLRHARGITCVLPDTLRFHPECWHGPTAKRYPALVAFVGGSSSFAVHRTCLLPDGSGKAAVNPAKAMLGAVAGGAVRISEASGTIVVAEGIETALSLASGLLNTSATILAALSTSGIRGLRLPNATGKLTIAPDGDRAGIAAAGVLAQRAHAMGWVVSLLPVPDGCDWNDILRMKGGNE